MVTVEELSIDNLRQIGGQDFNIMLSPSNPNFRVPIFGYKVSENADYFLLYKIEPRGIMLKDGLQTNGQGWLIVSKSNNEGVAFWSYTGQFSAMPNSLKQTVVNSFNSLSETQDEDSIESGELGERQQSRNEAGETVSEERERLRLEEAQANGFDSWEEYQEYLRLQEEAIERGETTPVLKPEDFPEYEGMIRRSEITIREIDETFTSTQEYLDSDATMERLIQGKIIEKTVENWSTQTNQYQVSNVSYQVTFTPNVSQDYVTQDEAEEFFDNYINQIQEDITDLAEDSARAIAENKTETVEEESVEVYWNKSDLSFEQALVSDIPPKDRPFFRQGLYRGGFGDAVKFTNQGNTLELVDFDTPRFTTEGISENLSGGIQLRVAYGWKVRLVIKSNSMSFTSESKTEVEDIEGIEINGDEFEVTMYGGDVLQIDIDNEREGLFPFVVTSAGVKWESIEEIDDEVFITMESLEQLWFRHEKVVREVFVNPPREGEIKSEEKEFDVKERVTFQDGSYLANNLTVNSEVSSLINQNPDYSESVKASRDILLADVPAEGSFVSPDDVTDDFGGIIDSAKPYLIGGIILAIIVGGVYVYINARARGGE